MTIDEVRAGYPLPKGFEWVQRGVQRWDAVSKEGESVTIEYFNGRGFSVDVVANGESHLVEIIEPDDLPRVYRRCLASVGLLSPWTTTPPTEPGYYLVWASEGIPPQVCELDEDGKWWDDNENAWTADKFKAGCQFMPCPMPGV